MQSQSHTQTRARVQNKRIVSVESLALVWCAALPAAAVQHAPLSVATAERIRRRRACRVSRTGTGAARALDGAALLAHGGSESAARAAQVGRADEATRARARARARRRGFGKVGEARLTGVEALVFGGGAVVRRQIGGTGQSTRLSLSLCLAEGTNSSPRRSVCACVCVLGAQHVGCGRGYASAARHEDR
eukprot:2461905-Pleurochrysis_carterae.AAC.1